MLTSIINRAGCASAFGAKFSFAHFIKDWETFESADYEKLLVINDYGTYIDGLKISDVSTLSLHLDYSSDIHLRLAVENDSEHVGGITLYGKSFGNYDQDIRVAINYAPLVAAQP